MDKEYKLFKNGEEVYKGKIRDCTHQYDLGIFDDNKSIWVLVDHKGNVIKRNKR